MHSSLPYRAAASPSLQCAQTKDLMGVTIEWPHTTAVLWRACVPNCIAPRAPVLQMVAVDSAGGGFKQLPILGRFLSVPLVYFALVVYVLAVVLNLQVSCGTVAVQKR